MAPEDIKNLLAFGGVFFSALTAIAMIFYKFKEFENHHENFLNKKLKSSIEYDEKFSKNARKNNFSKHVKDAAACDLVGSKDVDSFLVDLLLELNERKLIDLNEMIYLFKRGYKFGYLKYEKNIDIYECFSFRFSKSNSLQYYSNVEKVKNTKKMANISFYAFFIVLILYSLFFSYLVLTSTNFYDFAFPVIFGTITFFLAFLFPMLAIAMDDTSMFLSKFYNAYRIYDEQKKKEDREKLDMQSNSTCSNYSEYRRRY